MNGDLRQLTVIQKTDRGLVRGVNEDACATHIPDTGTPAATFGALFLVADGIGGMGSGEEASQTAVETVLSTYYDPELEDDDPRERIIAAIQEANEAVRARARTLNREAIGTTLAGAVILPTKRAYFFNVGDSRIYLLRDSALEQITFDHSAIDPVDANTSFAKAKLTAFIGQFQPIVPHIVMRTLQADDSLLICSDGLWGLVEQHEIAETIQRHSPQRAVDVLLKTVYERGARDNVTITLIQMRKQPERSYLWMMLALIILMVIGLLIASQIQSGSSTTPPETKIFMTNSGTSQTEESHGQLVIRTPDSSEN